MGHVLRLSNDWRPGVISLPKGHLAIPRDILVIPARGMNANGIPQVEGRNVLSIL